MTLGASTALFTQFHVLISLIGIASGVVVLAGMWGGKSVSTLTAVVLVTTLATSATGFLFHSASFGPPQILAVISLVVLAIAIAARHQFKLTGKARWIYVVSAVPSLYLNAFVGVIQAFQKLSLLHPLSPTGAEPPFAIAQLIALLLFVLGGYAAIRKFHPAAA